MEKQIKIALAGNPNSGKTTLFNALNKGISVNHSPKFHKAILYWGK